MSFDALLLLCVACQIVCQNVKIGSTIWKCKQKCVLPARKEQNFAAGSWGLTVASNAKKPINDAEVQTQLYLRWYLNLVWRSLTYKGSHSYCPTCGDVDFSPFGLFESRWIFFFFFSTADEKFSVWLDDEASVADEQLKVAWYLRQQRSGALMLSSIQWTVMGCCQNDSVSDCHSWVKRSELLPPIT